MDLSTRVERLEKQLRLFKLIASGALLLSLVMLVWIGASLRRSLRVPQVVVTSSTGARTIIEGGRIRLEEPGGNRVNVAVTEQTSTLALSTHERDPVAPEIVVRVGDARTPASILLSDRKARNFEHVYISEGRAGVEQAGVREYRNISTP